ncbi:MAG: ABC transporter permease [Treponema sp.]
MTVYKHFLRMVWQRKIGTAVFLAIFLSLYFVMLQPKKRDGQNFSETPLTVYIADQDHSPLAEQLIAYLQTKHRVTLLDDASLSDEVLLKKIRKDISVGLIDAGLIISENFTRKAELGQKGIISIKDGRRAAAFYIDSQIQNFLRFALSTKEAKGSFDFEKVRNALAVQAKVIKVNQGDDTSASVGLKYFFNFLGWAIFSLIINSIGWALFELHNERLRIRAAVSPVSNIRFAFENFAAQLTAVAVFLALLIAFAALIYRKAIHTLPLASYMLNAVVYAAVVLSAVFMLNAALKKGAVMGIVGTVLPLSLAFISGIFLDQELLPESITALAQVFPTYYYVRANTFTERMLCPDWRNIGMQLLFLLLYFTLGIYFSKLHRVRNTIEFAQK